MRKVAELNNPTSCINRALDTELTFVLLGRDAAAPWAILAWVRYRVATGKNKLMDGEIQEALRVAKQMDSERSYIRHAVNVMKAANVNLSRKDEPK